MGSFIMAQTPIKIFVGCDPNNCDLEQMMVLDYSIKKHTNAPYEIIWMQLSKDPNSFWYSDPEKGEGWNTERWVTPFSGFRWGIPAFCNFEGKAIYMDADIFVLSDIQKLWEHPFNEESIVVGKGEPLVTRLCVALWDCAKAQKVLPPIKKIKSDPKAHSKLTNMIKKKPSLVTPFNDNYNCLDGEDLPISEIKILHYTDIDTQFSHAYSIPRLQKEGAKHWFDGDVNPHWREDLTALFNQYYDEAIAAGYSLEDYRKPLYGDVLKASQKDYSAFRKVKKKNIISRLWKSLRGY